MKNVFLTLAILALAAGVLGGCNNNSGNGGAGGGAQTVPVIDLAIGNWAGFDPVPAEVTLFFDVLNNDNGNRDYSQPDLRLNEDGMTLVDLCTLNALIFDGDDLYLADVCGDFSGDGAIYRWSNYRDATEDQDPDLVLLTGIEDPHRLAISEDVLAVTNFANDTVGLYDGISGQTTDNGADVTLDNGTSRVSEPVGVVLADNRLFVANNEAFDAVNDPSVVIFDDVAAIISGGVAVAPDVELTQDTSFLGLGVGAKNIFLENGTLYVGLSNDIGGNTNNDFFVFNNADTLATDGLPDVVFTNSVYFFNVNGLVVNGDSQLIVGLGAANVPGCDATTDNFTYLAGFSPIDDLTDGQAADFVHTFAANGLVHMQRLFESQGYIFVGGYDNCDFDGSVLNVYLGNGLGADSVPLLTIEGEVSSLYDATQHPFSSIDGMAINLRE